MSYTPKYSAVNTRFIRRNLLTFIKTNQAAAILLFNGAALKPFYLTEDNLNRLDKPNLPTLEVVGGGERETEKEDITTLDCRFTFRSLVFAKSPVEVPDLVDLYFNVLKNLLLNVSESELLANIVEPIKLVGISQPEITYDEVLRNDQYSGFIQEFGVRVAYKLEASSQN